MQAKIRVLTIAIGSIFLLASSCKKEVCKVCYTEETIVNPPSPIDTITTEIGQVCGEELENTDGKTFTSVTGPARTYCE
jgi:hypothetical protein